MVGVKRLSKSKAYDYLIVGSGICGSTLAHLLNAIGKNILILEKKVYRR